jgi:hypothetical protein
VRGIDGKSTWHGRERPETGPKLLPRWTSRVRISSPEIGQGDRTAGAS